MKELALYLLLTLGGKTADAGAIKGAADAAGIAVDDEAVSSLLAAVEGKDLNEVVEAGRKKLVNIGGGGAAAPAAGGAAPAAAAEKKEEKKKEEEPEEEVGGAGGLFGGDDDDW